MTHPYRSADGLLSSSDPVVVARWDQMAIEQESAEQDWTTRLRAAGVKMAHPDDGWVNRKQSTFTPSYPRFDDRPQVGDLIAFGTPPDGEHYLPRHESGEWVRGKYLPGAVAEPESAHCGYRICRVTEVKERRGMLLALPPVYSYEDTGDRMPSRAPESTRLDKAKEWVHSWRR